MQKLQKTIAFHTNQLSIRGTEVAVFDYACGFRDLLGGRSIIVTPKESSGHDVRAAERFAQNFSIMPYSSAAELQTIIDRESVDLFYCIKAGFDDGLRAANCRTLVHAVFPHFEPHGDVYAYVSQWLSNEMSGGRQPNIPHIIDLPVVTGNLRSQLDIPKEAVVFGRFGGPESFDVPFVRDLIPLIAQKREDLVFLFANTPKFCAEHPRIMHIDGFSDPQMKVNFIATCDAMLHARVRGETFGLAVGEFSVLGKPVMTWGGSKERAHLEFLRENALIYKTPEELAMLLLSFERERRGKPCGYRELTPAAVMKVFAEVSGI